MKESIYLGTGLWWGTRDVSHTGARAALPLPLTLWMSLDRSERKDRWKKGNFKKMEAVESGADVTELQRWVQVGQDAAT